jgi:hypothetical protein
VLIYCNYFFGSIVNVTKREKSIPVIKAAVPQCNVTRNTQLMFEQY